MPKFRNLWEHIRPKMPKRGRGKAVGLDVEAGPRLHRRRALLRASGMMPTHGEPTCPAAGFDAFGDPMTRNEVLRLLRRHKATLARRFGVIELALYGSFARDRGSEDSDVDILVRFDAPPDWKRYFGAQAYLEDLLGRSVDMATSRELRAEIRPYVEREAIDV